MPEPASQETSSDATVFISYSRKDMGFVDRLDAALQARGIRTLVDRVAIEIGEPWRKRLQDLIARAETIVFVLSPDSVASKVCAEEVDWGKRLGKRFIPVVARRIDDPRVPEALSELNYVYLDEEESYEARLDRLAAAIRTDFTWMRAHADLGRLADEWNRAGRPRGLLLGGTRLTEAEGWLTHRPATAPLPTPDTHAWITASRRLTRQWRNGVMGALAAALVIALGLAAYARIQQQEAVAQRAVAERQTAVAEQQTALANERENEALEQQRIAQRNLDEARRRQSRYLADQSRQQRAFGDSATALALAIETLPDPEGEPRPYLPEAEMQLDASVRSLRERAILRENRGFTNVSWSPDGDRVATLSGYDTLLIWDLATGRPIASPTTIKGVASVDWSPDGRSIVTGASDGAIRLWDPQSGLEIGPPAFPTGARIRDVAWSPDGSWVAVAMQDKVAAIWDVGKQQLVGPLLRGHEGNVVSVAWSPDGRRLVTTSYDRTARIWNVGGSGREWILRGHDAYVVDAAWSPDGRKVVTASNDKTARIWDADTGRQIGEPWRGHEREVTSVSWSKDGLRILTATTDGTAQVWDPETRQMDGPPLRGHEQLVNKAVWSRDGTRIATASSDRTVRIWSANNAATVRGLVLRGHARGVSGTSWSPDGTRLVTASFDGTARIWDSITGQPAGQPLSMRGTAISRAIWSPDGRVIATTGGHFVQIWDRTGRPIGEPWQAEDGITAAVWGPDGGMMVLGHTSGAASIRLAERGQRLWSIPAHSYSAIGIDWSRDGKRIAVGATDGTIRIFDVETRRQLDATLIKATFWGLLWSLAWSPDGTRLLTGWSDGSYRTWNPDTGARSASPGHLAEVVSASWSPDGGRILTTGGDHSVRVWDVRTGEEVARIFEGDKTTGIVRGGSWSPDGRRLAAGLEDGTARIWPIFPTTEALMAHAKAITPRCLSSFDRTRFFITSDQPLWCIRRFGPQ